jgi:YidC/Oxa1 family membrane protein insertase
MTFFDYILAPFVFLLKEIFLFCYAITGSYGLSIVLLSLAVSLILLPVFIYIERSRKKDLAVKQKMKPVLDEIKRCYKGQERYYYIKTLNRQHGYNPMRALIPTLSLLLQIPFFIAAYQFLENFDPLAGTRFLFIDDLSKADGLWGHLNFLPIAMTFINLVTAYFYTRHSDTSERKQMVIVAAIFLILLYNLPSGLVLYWTMNNVFSFFRLFITNPEVFKSTKATSVPNKITLSALKLSLLKTKPRLMKAFFVILVIALLTQLNRAFEHNFDDILQRILYSVLISLLLTGVFQIIVCFFRRKKNFLISNFLSVKPQTFYLLLFFSVYFYFSAKFYFGGVNYQLSLLSLLFILPVQLIGFTHFLKWFSFDSSFWKQLFLVSLIFLVLIQITLLINHFGKIPIRLDIQNIVILFENSTILDLASIGIFFSLITLSHYSNSHALKHFLPNKLNSYIFLAASIYMIGLIFLWHPLIVFSSDVHSFEFVAIKILQNNYKIFLASIIGLILIYILLPDKTKTIVTFISVCFTLIIFINSSLFPIQLGSLQESRFSEQDNLAAPGFYYYIEALIIVGIFYLIRWVFIKSQMKPLLISLIILNFTVIGYSIGKSIKTNRFFPDKKLITGLSNEAQHKGFSFSTKKPNVVFIIADGFQGWFMDKIIKENPEIRKSLQGFVWFPNTISVSNYTHSSLPALLNGHDFGVEWMNKTDQKNIGEKISESGRIFLKRIKDHGYFFSGKKFHYANLKDEEYDHVVNEWNKEWKKFSDIVVLSGFGQIWYKRLYENALLLSLPLAIKPKIYNNAKWLDYDFKKSNEPATTPNKASLQKYNFIRLLPFISRNTSNKAKFIYIHSHATHNPWNVIAGNGQIKDNVSPYENNKWFIEEIIKWFDWMKENNVYDNTRIVMVSDHGASWGLWDSPKNFDLKLKNKEKMPISLNNFLWLQPLFLFKDFDSNEPFSEDHRLMSNADAADFFFNINPFEIIDHERSLDAYLILWDSHLLEQKLLRIHSHLEVKENIFDMNNWKKR